MIQSESRYHTEHVNFEPDGQHKDYKILQDFHVVRADHNIIDYLNVITLIIQKRSKY
jgi:hypothetical protein